ncbi:hypothetical protein GGR58DRAFT_521908 [Xylaria digitata]|nr:hypothetical protein GGR58DRAFT_521908 [Xylaria digitata]
MNLTAPAIIGIVGLLLMSIPGIRCILRKIRRKLKSQRNQQSNGGTVLPLSDHTSVYVRAASSMPIDTLGISHQIMQREALGDPTIPGFQGFVAVSMGAAVFWPPIDRPPRRGDRSMNEGMIFTTVLDEYAGWRLVGMLFKFRMVLARGETEARQLYGASPRLPLNMHETRSGVLKKKTAVQDPGTKETATYG